MNTAGGPETGVNWPTAMHRAELAHDTANKLAVFGTDRLDHVSPPSVETAAIE